MTNQGRFITFEGGEGCGKTTQIQILEESLKSKNIPVIKVREPGSTVGSELLRKVLKDTEGTEWDAISQVLILYAARRDLVQKVIKPALGQGTWVICDRFADSTFVYQGHTQEVGIDFVRTIHQATLKDFAPDLTFFFDLPPEEGMKRARKRNSKDFFEEKSLSFHRKVYEGYKILSHESKRIITVPANQSIKLISEKIMKTLQEKFYISF
ncbi:MAG: dTMP kinase [Holosporaceae bacterium]|nr:MAG: dTMP kinase [Holosporaceae bacterium]